LAASPDLEDAKRRMATNIKDPEIGALLQRATENTPADPEAWHFLGRWAVANNRMLTAVKALEQAQSLAPDHPAATMQNYSLLAAAYDGLVHLPEAERCFERALAANRSLPVFLSASAYEYVRFLEREKRETQALPIVNEILHHDPHYSPALLSKARAAARAKRYSEAALLAEQALLHRKGSRLDQRATHHFLAVTYIRLKNEAKARIHRDWLAADDARDQR